MSTLNGGPAFPDEFDEGMSLHTYATIEMMKVLITNGLASDDALTQASHIADNIVKAVKE